jgi:hypothetical protein
VHLFANLSDVGAPRQRPVHAADHIAE